MPESTAEGEECSNKGTTTKAPRKRTFLLTMTKYNSGLATPPGVAAAVFANNVAMLSYAPCCDDEVALNSGGFGPLADMPVFRRTSTSSNTPSTGSSIASSTSSSSSSSYRPLPRSKVMHVACKGSTLVVPLTGAGGDKAVVPPKGLTGPWQRAKIVDAPIVLSGNEIAVLNLPQYRVRESMLV
ncbi:hypothetical protein VOLCADRAFT_99922 [Volvox carteri f. nagariensis]|uniref:Uncharacterized protein n=1 Tax=Volvox carteri f. nagariensis TaxID=3068 RepID=D8UIZ5_VOLCA|nr:uncharacterized protein VOLCADRAFT_99922 [Volvox carteri f. nagariensis]EFJ40306.1 hypothetical protein VOLCADRAFT_99922 [Volvox carteri f. nagariensis]|eukprot:XP_002958640.1 hypothetical protein VOLCADRAFT_99922 [Volvox carteri f. nagariensis]